MLPRISRVKNCVDVVQNPIYTGPRLVSVQLLNGSIRKEKYFNRKWNRSTTVQHSFRCSQFATGNELAVIAASNFN